MDHARLPHLTPLALEWANMQEAFILEHGAPLRPAQLEDAKLAGVLQTGRVRVLIVDRIAPPENAELAAAAQRAQVITEASRAVTVGHGIVLRADAWQDRELLVHALVHVAQCERRGGLAHFVEEYLVDRATCADFRVGALEDEARGLAREICAGQAPTR